MKCVQRTRESYYIEFEYVFRQAKVTNVLANENCRVKERNINKVIRHINRTGKLNTKCKYKVYKLVFAATL